MADLTSSLSFLTENPAAAAIKDAYISFSDRRALLNLPNPGTVDNLAREVQKEVMLSNFMFSGLRSDLTKVFGMSPLFRVSHAFSMGSSGNMPPYNFSAMYGSPKVRPSLSSNRSNNSPSTSLLDQIADQSVICQ